jgi:hypothetical protein
LGILQLEFQNEALLLKYFHKLFNKADVPWVHLVWEKYYSNGKLPNHTIALFGYSSRARVRASF